MHAFLGNGLLSGPRWSPPIAIRTQPDAKHTGFGSGIALADAGAFRVVVIGEKGRTVGVDDARQVYVYRLAGPF